MCSATIAKRKSTSKKNAYNSMKILMDVVKTKNRIKQG